MKAQNLSTAAILFIFGAFLGAGLTLPVSDWIASAAPPSVARLPFDQSDRVRQSLFWALWAGSLFASAPLAAMLSGRLSQSFRLVVLLATIAVIVASVFVTFGRRILAEPIPADVVATIRVSDISLFSPALCGIIAVAVSALTARLFPNDRHA